MTGNIIVCVRRIASDAYHWYEDFTKLTMWPFIGEGVVHQATSQLSMKLEFKYAPTHICCLSEQDSPDVGQRLKLAETKLCNASCNSWIRIEGNGGQ